MATAHSQDSQARIVRQIWTRNNKFSAKWALWILTTRKKSRKPGLQPAALPLTTTVLDRPWTPSEAALRHETIRRKVFQSSDEDHRPVEEVMATTPSQVLGHPRGR